MCKRESSAKFDGTVQPYSDETGQFAPLITIECRGLEFVGFDPRGTWKCVGTTGMVFPEVEIEGPDSEWVDYDEKAAMPVGVSAIECQWTRAQ
ncbi:hypothetical protein HGRIS_008020 [Hohenbuehelia grisea]|uniref:Uncharacterized protein n=1 Tax=Hohenbuehelia grisea TaxID=104357 RepID=A0ABR3J6N8_9AGAR